MYPVSSRFLDALKTSHNVTLRCEIRSALGKKLIDLYPNSGAVTVDSNNYSRRTLSLSLVDETTPNTLTTPVYNTYADVINQYATYAILLSSNLTYANVLVILTFTVVTEASSQYVPVNAFSPLTPFGNEIWVWRGIEFADGTVEEVPLGVFLITNVEVSQSESGVSITVNGSDRSLKISRNKPTASYASGYDTIGSGNGTINLVTALTALVKTFYSDVQINFQPVTAITVNQFAIGVGEDPWAKAVSIANDCGYDLFFDASGVCTMEIFPEPSTNTADFSYVEGAEATLTNVSKRLSSENTYNGVNLTASGTSMLEPFTSVAWDDDSSSPTYRYGGFGQAPIFLSSNLLGSQAQVTRSARSLLNRYIGASSEISWSSIVNPAHDVYDIIQIQNTGTQTNAVLVLDSLTIPFSPSEIMSAKARAVRFLPLS